MATIDGELLGWLIDLAQEAVASDCCVIASDPMAKHAISEAQKARSDAYAPPAPVLTEEERKALQLAKAALVDMEPQTVAVRNRAFQTLQDLLARTATKQSADSFKASIEAAAQEVQEWPDWKKGALDASFRSSNSESRVPDTECPSDQDTKQSAADAAGGE